MWGIYGSFLSILQTLFAQLSTYIPSIYHTHDKMEAQLTLSFPPSGGHHYQATWVDSGFDISSKDLIQEHYAISMHVLTGLISPPSVTVCHEGVPLTHYGWACAASTRTLGLWNNTRTPPVEVFIHSHPVYLGQVSCFFFYLTEQGKDASALSCHTTPTDVWTCWNTSHDISRGAASPKEASQHTWV